MKGSRWLAGICVALAALSLGVGQRGQQPPPPSQQPEDADQLVAKWKDALTTHIPGQHDDAVRWLGALSVDQWKLLNTGLKQYFGVLGAAGRAAMNGVVARAAVLHMDTARFGPLAPASKVNSGGWTGPAPSLVRTLDGESLGSMDANWNWILARQLIDLMYPSPKGVPFVAAWYHAAAAWMLEHGLYGEVDAHLQRAAAVAPDDPRILFDRACLAEALALPRSQSVMDDLRAKQAASNRRATFIPGQPAPIVPANPFPPAEQWIAAAERGFRRTLDIDASAVEARVRLARLLTLQKKYGEASAELKKALADDALTRDFILAYYAHLFAARASQGLGRLDDAAAQLAQALALFPDAQSGLMAESQLALLRSDADGALAPIRKLAVVPKDPQRRQDPWWLYDTGPGRQTELYMADMRARLAAVK
ncbi:MAG TPA: hypothetical protein VLT86_02465 [Vicinamibacterales bacterium]|nr:hypothetical protein [Vicinamibacterales bacterium]